MSSKGKLTREQAIQAVGVTAVDAVDAANCDFTGRIQTDGDPRAEFSASVGCKDQDGEDVTLTAYYYQDQADVDAVESLDQLDWVVDGYAIT